MTDEGHPAGPAAPGARPNCLRTVGITCLVSLVVGVAIVAWIAIMISKNPTFRQVYSGAYLAAECQKNLQHPDPHNTQDISGALERYARRNGKYPASLKELYPNFLENRRTLHCPADSRPVGVVSYEYTPPAMNAPPTTVVIRCGRHAIIRGQPPLVLLLYKDGRVCTQKPAGAPHGP